MFKEFLDEIKVIFNETRPKKICEIGTHGGKSALQMLDYLLKYDYPVEYTGYDVWDGGSVELDKKEDNGKGWRSLSKVQKKFADFKKEHNNLNFFLIKGNTHDTLKSPKKFDFAFIDGGHSYETVKHDYEMLKETPVIVLDDTDLPGPKRLFEELKSDETLIVKEIIPSTGKGVTDKRVHTQAIVRRK